MKRPVRIALIATAATVVLAVGAGTAMLLSFDPNSYKPDIVAAVKRATGRDLVLNGKIGLKLSLAPTLQVSDVAFSNPPGFSRPQMATLQGMEIQVAVLPLISGRIQIDRLVLIRPDILLETNAQGQPNWQMQPQVSPEAPPGSQAGAAPAKTGGRSATVSVDSLRIQDGTLAWRDDRTGKVLTLGLPRLDAEAASPDAPLHLDMDGRYNGTAFTLAADTGSLVRLQDPAATTPWPVRLTLATQGARLAADGTLTQPMQGKGYVLSVNGAAPDVAALAPLLPGVKLPPLHDVTFAARVADKGGRLPEVSAVTLHAGNADLNAYTPGLVLSALDVKAPSVDQPFQATASGKMGDAPLSLAATLGAPGLLMPDAKPAAFPIDITASAAGANLTAKGSIANAQALGGANIALAAQIPDLSALSPLVRHSLPALKQVAFKGTVTDDGKGLRNAAALHGISLTSADGDLAGDASVTLAPRLALIAALKSNRIDLDALAKDEPPTAPPPSGQPAPPPPPEKRDQRIFSDQKLPFTLLRVADADITLDVAVLHANGADTHAIAVHAGLKDGKLAVDRFNADGPAGRMSGTLTVNADQPAPPVHLTLHAPGLALKTILAMARQQPLANGNLEVYADLSGVGDSPHAIASTLAGHLGLAVQGGTIDNRVLGSVLGRVLEAVNALDLVGRGGTSELRCLAVRVDARNGDAAVNPLALSSSLLSMTGSGAANLGAETVGLVLRPEMRLGATSLVVPVRITGPMRTPAIAVDRLGAAESNVGTVAGAVAGSATPIGILGGLLGADKALGLAGGDMCPAALAAARGQPAPAQTAQPAATPAGKAENGIKDAGAALKNLFR